MSIDAEREGRVYAGSRADLDAEGRLLVSIGGTEVGVLEHNGRLYAFENRCLHQGGPVCEGIVLGRVVATITDEGRVVDERFDAERPQLICPWHGWEYDLASGRAAGAPDLALRRFEVAEEDGAVYVIADLGVSR